VSILDYIKNFIRVEFSYESGRKVSDITSSLTKTVSKLEGHAKRQMDLAQRKTEQAARLLSQREDHVGEHAAANRVATNIKNLLG
jgi:hypothetical protein